MGDVMTQVGEINFRPPFPFPLINQAGFPESVHIILILRQLFDNLGFCRVCLFTNFIQRLSNDMIASIQLFVHLEPFDVARSDRGLNRAFEMKAGIAHHSMKWRKPVSQPAKVLEANPSSREAKGPTDLLAV